MSRLAGRVAIVTGAGRGIGRALAASLAGEGAAVVLNDLDPEVANAATHDLVAHGHVAVAVPGDVTSPGVADDLVQAAVEGLGGLDVIVNNAGYTWDATIQNTSDQQFQAMLDVHLVAPFRLLRAAQPHLKEAHRRDREAGIRRVRKVVNVSSLSGTGGAAGQVAYATAKAGLSGLTKSLAKEWGRYDVTVNAVAFGLVDTRLTRDLDENASVQIGDRRVRVGVSPDLKLRTIQNVPLGRVATEDEAAGAIAMLIHPDADYVSGQVVLCAGGFVM